MPIRKTIRRRFATGMVAFFVALAAPQPGFTRLGPTVVEAQRAELQKFIQRKVLSNGLEIIVVENHGVPLVTVEVDVKNGSFTQTPEYAGLAHMYEHMFFKANARFPEPEAFVGRAGDLGAVFNGTTQEEIGRASCRERV